MKPLWSVIVAADDCTSVQVLHCKAVCAQDAAREAFAEVGWLDGYRLIAVVEGTPEIAVRDDARTAEFGLL